MQKTPFTIENGQLSISGRKVTTAYPVAQAISLEGMIVARLEVPVGTVMNSNVLGFAENGDLRWSIEESPHGGLSDNPYVAIEMRNNNLIVARNWDGVEYEVSLTDGAVTTIGFRRMG